MEMVAHHCEREACHTREDRFDNGCSGKWLHFTTVREKKREKAMHLSDPRTSQCHRGSVGRQSWGCFLMAREATTREHANVTVRHATGQVSYPTAGRLIVLKRLERHEAINLRNSLQATAENGLNLLHQLKCLLPQAGAQCTYQLFPLNWRELINVQNFPIDGELKWVFIMNM